VTITTLPPPRQAVPPWKRGLETALFTSAGPALGLLLHAGDPSFATARFFWPVLGPVVAGLRYGAVHALGGAAMLLAGVAAFHGLDGRCMELAAGTLTLALVAGEFGDRWQRRLERLDQVTRADHLRTDRLARALLTLELSQERLLAEPPGARAPLSAALARFEETVRRGHGDDDERHREVLRFLSEHGRLQMARLHPVGLDGRLQPATAWLGADFDADEEDPVVADALARRQVVAVDSEHDAGLGPVLAALPLVDAAKRFVALVVVHELPYEAVRPAALRELAVLCARLADVLTRARQTPAHAPPGPRLAGGAAEIIHDEPMVGRVGT
jgi:hypothetical protein